MAYLPSEHAPPLKKKDKFSPYDVLMLRHCRPLYCRAFEFPPISYKNVKEVQNPEVGVTLAPLNSKYFESYVTL